MYIHVHVCIQLFVSLNPISIDYKIVRIESTDGTELTDLKAPPPDTVYIVGVRT